MMMFLTRLRTTALIIMMCFLLSGCFVIRQNLFANNQTEMTYPGKKIDASGQMVSADLEFEGYTKVIVEGTFDIESVNASSRDKTIRVIGDKAFVTHIQGQQQGDTLYIRLDPQFDYVINKPVILQIPIRNLSYLKFKGLGNIILENYRSPCLSVDIQGKVNAWIKGNLILASLNFDSDGKLVMYWINSTCVRINAGKKSTLLLGGLADNLEVNSKDCAYVDAKFLRAKTAHIHSKDCSRVDVSVSNNLNAIAEDNSNIYYYHQRPKFMGNYMHGSGSIMDMHDVYAPYPKILR